MSIACDVIVYVRYCWTQVPLSFHAFFPLRGRLVLPRLFLVLVEHYATLVAYPALFHKYPKPFLCLIGMSRNYSLDENTYPQFLRNDDEEMDLLSFIRTADPTKVRIGERERDEDEPRQLETTVGRVVQLLPVALDRSSGELEASVDKLFDEGGSGEGGVMPTFPFVSSFVFTTSEREGEDHTELLAGANLRTLEAPQRFVISFDSSDYSGANIAEAEVDSIVRTSVPIMTSATTATPTADPAATANKRLVGSLVFGGDSSSEGGSHPIFGGFSDRTGSDFLVGGIRTVVDHDSNIQRVYVPQWNVTNGFCMDDRYNIKEKRRLKSVVEEKDVLLKSRCDEIESLKARLIVKEAEAAEVVYLRDEAQALKERNINLEKEKSELEVKVTDLAASVKVREQEVADLDAVVTSDEKIKEVNEKFDKLCIDFVDMALHLKETFYLCLLATISGRRWLLTHGMELAIAKCLNSTEYLYALGATIGKAIKKGIHEGLSAGIAHGAEGRTLTDVATYNPYAEADYLYALQCLQSVNFPLIAKLKTNKDVSVEVIMNLLRLEDALAEKLGLVESQPHVDQLMVHIHHSPDQRVVALRGVFVPLSEPLSAMALECMEGTFGAALDTTTALSVTSISASIILPSSTDNYEIAHTEGGEGVVVDVEAIADEGEDPFPDVSGAELDVPE
nr:putative transposase (putative), gypsy type [Tanacetum cinerariifolium]